MAMNRWGFALAVLTSLTMVVAGPSAAAADSRFGPVPDVNISFVQFQSPDLTKPPGTMLTIQGKLSVPRHAARPQDDRGQRGKLPAVLILHGSAGVDSRGDSTRLHSTTRASPRCRSTCGRHAATTLPASVRQRST